MKSEINKSLENFELSSKYLEKVIELKDSLKKLDAKDEQNLSLKLNKVR